MRQLAYKVCQTKYQVSFSLWLIGSVLKYCKVPKHDQDCLKIFFLLSTLPMMIQIFGKNGSLAQKCYFYQKTTNNQRWKLFKVKFFAKIKHAKQCLQQTIKFATLTQLTCFIFLLKFIEMFCNYKKCQKIIVGRRLSRVRIKNLYSQTIPGKIFGTKWNNQVKLDIKRKVWYLFLRVL